ncbi:DHHA1 domain-containing protein [Mesobacillus subterraneus]|uniref:DHH family phosphoesterase n=1 Tax=Mesobacillus subterraneus TaxID=285983 RepID=UPI0020425632|nr:DHHA1 domain-containing protein [Mesobacillus subterraneus]MCM3573878.1 DHHA1 domain-containing protein [Mesobacillus subterraneus]
MYRLFTHNDLDGVACGILFRLAFGEKADVRYNSVSGLNFQVEKYFDRMNDRMKKEDHLYITDLSVNHENTEKINQFVNEGGKAKLIDHHKTAMHFNEYSWGRVIVEDESGTLTSAASLVYDYLVQENHLVKNGSLDEFVELVRQYDTWDWDILKNYKAKNLNDLFFMVSIEEFEERMVPRLTSGDRFDYDDFEKKLLEMEEDKIERYIRRKKREIIQIETDGLYGGVVHAESYHSELGNELGKEYPHLDYIAILNLGGKKISFRTIHDDVDVSAVAGEFGGGGHAKASGCSINKEAYNRYIEQAFPLDPIKPDAFRNTYNLKDSKNGCLYENRDRDFYLIYTDGTRYFVQQESKERHGPFEGFELAERFVKREYGAALARDDVYISYLENIVFNGGN